MTFREEKRDEEKGKGKRRGEKKRGRRRERVRKTKEFQMKFQRQRDQLKVILCAVMDSLLRETLYSQPAHLSEPARPYSVKCQRLAAYSLCVCMCECV